ncbi:MAG: amidophosphoribosyltransferase [Bacilli bacterium]
MIKLDYDDDKFHEECGVFGVYNVENASSLTYYGLHALQHRGQEGGGIVSYDNGNIHYHKGLGLVQEIFDNSKLDKLVGDSAIGHVRYSTAGGNNLDNTQPFVFTNTNNSFALCHNGNIVNAEKLKIKLEDLGSIFHSSSDSEIIAHLIRREKSRDLFTDLKKSLTKLKGAFAFLLITKDKVYAMRDKWGLRPLSLGKLKGGYILSSETCAFDVVGAEFIRDLVPGEIIEISESGIKSEMYANSDMHLCAMEFIYFSRPDTDIEEINVHATRKNAGKILAKKYGVEADIVVGVPDSSISAAIGYAEESNIPYEMGIIKNKYVGRTFIQPSQDLRELGVKLKLSAVKSLVANKRVVMVDDSIVRGTTSKKIVQMLKSAGAKEVHVRIASPKIIAPCFYGVDTSSYEELIATTVTQDQLREKIGATSLEFLECDEIKEAIRGDNLHKCGLCMACFNENYPTEIFTNIKK